MSRGGQSLVYVVNGTPQAARAEVRPIRIGESVGSRFVVLDGLRAGDLVVVRGNERITAGQAIRFQAHSGSRNRCPTRLRSRRPLRRRNAIPDRRRRPARNPNRVRVRIRVLSGRA